VLTAAMVAGATLVHAAPDGWLTALGYAAFAAAIRVQTRAFDSGLDREVFVGLVERYASGR
jgi:hypothetical protein